jgi:hypothetical protein
MTGSKEWRYPRLSLINLIWKASFKKWFFEQEFSPISKLNGDDDNLPGVSYEFVEIIKNWAILKAYMRSNSTNLISNMAQ